MLSNQGILPNEQKISQSLSSILTGVGLSHSDTDLASDLTQAFEMRAFQLGDELVNYNLAKPSENSVAQEQNLGGFYIICQGRVRLLGCDAVEGRDVSTLVLEEGESFGTEAFFADIPTLSRAIAASVGELAWIPLDKLQPWLERLPQLREYLHSTALSRATLIFFKTSTDLRRLPVVSLKQLLPYLLKTQMPAGEALVDLADSGRFWLRSGEIRQGEQVTVSTVGESWGYPNPTLAD